ncbi:MAG: GNAT family N-acetyltransferase [Anaerolineaceae bacterium]|nr:GNAT family N-acetyltransferase [Anaerolineaceae bacterium]
MQIKVYQDIESFLEIAQPVLARDIPRNNLILGVALQIKQEPDRYQSPPFLAIGEEAGKLQIIAVMTPPFGILIYAETPDKKGQFSTLIDKLIMNDWTVPGVNGLEIITRDFAENWMEKTGESIEIGMQSRVFMLDKVIFPKKPADGNLRQAMENDQELIADWLKGFHQEALGENEVDDWGHERASYMISHEEVFIWEDACKPVSMAARVRPLLDSICVSAVYTPPELRNKGYASTCVAALSQFLLNEGRRICALFTDITNPTSNAIYQSIGYRPVCDFVEFRFVNRSK